MREYYCNDFLNYQRRDSLVVTIGGIPMGGTFPISVQSMTNTDTCNTEDSIQQIKKIADRGSDYVRLTVPGQKDVENLKVIKEGLDKIGYKIPLIADVHFNARLAHLAAAIVDKVRINPGNFIDKKNKTDDIASIIDYEEDLLKLRNEFLKLLDICRENNTALRIGTNHGSLADRIMDQFGDTPEGMVESAMEFLRICKETAFNNVVVSMKASNTRVMVYATRLLLERMNLEGMNYPLHLGVTEAGEGEDGRIKSAVGIGALLADGIGETIRVSLTEDPEDEIPVAFKLVSYFKQRQDHDAIAAFGNYPISPYKYKRRNTIPVKFIGGTNVPVVLGNLKGEVSANVLQQFGWNLSNNNEWKFSDTAADILIVDTWPGELPRPINKQIVYNSKTNTEISEKIGEIYWINYEVYKLIKPKASSYYFISVKASGLTNLEIEKIKGRKNIIIILETDNANGYADQRAAIFRLVNKNCQLPVILKRSYKESLKEDFQLKAAADFGGLFIDGLGDGIWIENSGQLTTKEIIDTSFGILQASRVRTSKTEYISCPSCGRTLFDLQSATRKIRQYTSHLKGLKIGIMGCIVNGPGEMADADYGYVGTGKGKITLYKEREIIKRNVAEENAVEELINLIKENGDWIDP